MMLLQESIELEKDIMALLHLVELNWMNLSGGGQTLAVVLLHPTKALAAAWIAVVVSVDPISGIFPSTSLVAGSGSYRQQFTLQI